MVGQANKTKILKENPASCLPLEHGTIVSMPDGNCALYAINMLFSFSSVEERERVMLILLANVVGQDALSTTFITAFLHPTSVASRILNDIDSAVSSVSAAPHVNALIMIRN